MIWFVIGFGKRTSIALASVVDIDYLLPLKLDWAKEWIDSSRSKVQAEKIYGKSSRKD